MKDLETEKQAKGLVLEYELDASPEAVWRAISIASFREKWLPAGDLADVEPVSSTPGEEVRYRMREQEPPFLESVVAFQIDPNAEGGTTLRVVHRLVDAAPREQPSAANSNQILMMLAA